MFDEVTQEERDEIGRRLHQAQLEFEREHKERLRSSAIQLGEKLDGTYTRYDLNQANEWLEEHGFRRAVPSLANDPDGAWISVQEVLPVIPDGQDSVKVSVKFAPEESPHAAFYHRRVGLVSCPDAGFGLEVPIRDINNRTISSGSSSPVEPTHWRLRD
ncbi:hypothetical protein [Paraburkholderia sp. J8-2]|uniref:hypothetical protein n=1 Tax=Paraburkholderia sp. J8-2 TaxID=2805440 RepID=UPI002AB611A1|nr:hypothetical protein [Paraburkholderia sp. J8-2]